MLEVHERQQLRSVARNLLVFAIGSNIVTSMVRTACDRDEAWFKLVEPTDRCLVAALLCVSEWYKTIKIDSLVDALKLLDAGDRYPTQVGDKYHAAVIFADRKFGGLANSVSRKAEVD